MKMVSLEEKFKYVLGNTFYQTLASNIQIVKTKYTKQLTSGEVGWGWKNSKVGKIGGKLAS